MSDKVRQFDDKVVFISGGARVQGRTSNAMLFLASEEARHITGAVLPIDLGELAK